MIAEFTFYGPLNDFLPPEKRSLSFAVEFLLPGAVKDMIEAAGVPHPEIDLIVANGRAVDFSYQVQNGDRIAVYPASLTIDSPCALRPPWPADTPPRFVLDSHLGTLAGYLRMLGFDTVYRNDFSDEELAFVSNRDNRYLLTRDRGLLKRNEVVHGCYVRETAPRAQLLELAQRFQLRRFLRLFQRCIRCNGNLRAASKDAVLARLPQRTAKEFDDFSACDSCGRVYWRGSHFHHMKRFIADVLGLKD